MTDRAAVAPANAGAGLLERLVPALAPAGQLVVDAAGNRIIDAALGEAVDNDGAAISTATLFDLASVTKIFTALAFMCLVERGDVELDEPVAHRLPNYGAGSVSADRVTWRQLLSHTAGLPAGVDLAPDANPGLARDVVMAIRPTAEPGSAVLYSDVGFMVLGFGIEAITGEPLDRAIDELVCKPAGLGASYRPDVGRSIAPTEFIPSRGGRLRGQVHDENAAALWGVAGHAGLFASAGDMARLGGILLAGGAPLLSPAWVAEMTREQAVDGPWRRGLGFSLWSPDPVATSHPLGESSYGHSGYTGTSLWIDPERGLVVALLTNAVYRGRDFGEFFDARLHMHRDIAAIADHVAAGQEGVR